MRYLSYQLIEHKCVSIYNLLYVNSTLPPIIPIHSAHTGRPNMSNFGRIIGLLAALAMFLFSSYLLLKTDDWVAAVFAVGSLGYIVFFYVVYPRGD